MHCNKKHLVDDLVGAGKQRRRDFDAERRRSGHAAPRLQANFRFTPAKLARTPK